MNITISHNAVPAVAPGEDASRALLGHSQTLVNGLISPTSTPGMVTRPLSTQQPDGIVPIDSAIAPLKDMGGSSVKLFPMGGLACRDEYQAMAEASARHGFWLDPTLENLEEIVLIALGAGVQKVLPHVYSSIIDSESGQTRTDDVRTLLDMVKQLLSD
ncbi:KDGP aldolase [Aeromonas sobria]|uniref:KDGP aldolase n=1 Tax=Aeromonas sobria TaxID=646 RepID=UPI0021CCC105|nr:KDGP aldolase [Aeromonas sobria]